jgi:hypothetical protein
MHVSHNSGILLRTKIKVRNFIKKHCHNFIVHDYRQGFGLLDLLTTYMLYYTQQQHHPYFHTLQFAFTHTSVLSLLESPLSISWQQILTQEP